MCILLATTAHPDYELILISNRDEFLQRKTHTSCWHNDDFILSPYDMAKECKYNDKKVFGTWLGINKDGKIATVLNLKLNKSLSLKQLVAPKSRGMLPFVYLSDMTEDSFAEWDGYDNFTKKYPGLQSTGDFNLFYGDVKRKQYRIMDSIGNTVSTLNSNCQYLVVSNDVFTCNGQLGELQSNIKREGKQPCLQSKIETWGKVKLGTALLQSLVNKSIVEKQDEDTIISECFKLSSTCSVTVEDHCKFHQNSTLPNETILVPPLRCKITDDVGTSLPIGEYYGTRSQIVILIKRGTYEVKFAEHVIYTSDSDIKTFSPANPKETVRFDFTLNR
ncbi:uncharacterized protein NDAI_0G00970 [Naumovozyma dairenensis CBS 421]|uniref:DUF833 domain-containing protein n=1 Tax=Naumovozyma dairenensis (strain ATCC 10597 / BCRC 20456 / CBS 421 / NBRC 0211 / NRRL Y-12639) TaxID=1071378 RepID=G0WDL2_NAUDC|nr:hypothetical protein NDAI_0G00970 [Naumovozyma dairenensis CBS 421]CCD25873.2 hypothetical protein NDAI_0G00970 [Naumovozyma dairenensis CBS 421]